MRLANEIVEDEDVESLRNLTGRREGPPQIAVENLIWNGCNVNEEEEDKNTVMNSLDDEDEGLIQETVLIFCWTVFVDDDTTTSIYRADQTESARSRTQTR